MKLKIKESIIEIEPVKSNALLQLIFLLKLGKKKKSYKVSHEFLEEIVEEFTFYYKLLEQAGIFPYEKSEIKEDKNV